MQDILCLIALVELFRGGGYYIGSFFSEKPTKEIRLQKGIRHLILSFSIMNVCFLLDMGKRIERLEKNVATLQVRETAHSLTNHIQTAHERTD